MKMSDNTYFENWTRGSFVQLNLPNRYGILVNSCNIASSELQKVISEL